MADVVLKIQLEGAQQAETGIDAVSKAFGDVSTASKKAAEDTTKGFKETATEGAKLGDALKNGIPKINFDKPFQSIKELKKEITAFTNEAIRAGQGTKAFANAMAEAGARKKELKELQQTVAALNPDKQATAFLNLSRTIIEGFAAGTGALAVFGVEGKDMEKTLVKIQALLAFGSFVGGLGQLGSEFEILKTQIQNSAAAQKVFNFIMNQNPYVLAATALVALGSALYAADKLLEDDTTAFLKNSEAVKKSKEERDKLHDIITNLAIDLQVELGIIDKNQGEKLKSFNKYTKDYKEIQDRFNADIQKAREEGESGGIVGAENAKKTILRLKQEEAKELTALQRAQKLQETLDEVKSLNEKRKATEAFTKKQLEENKKAADDAAKKLAEDELKRDEERTNRAQKSNDDNDKRFLDQEQKSAEERTKRAQERNDANDKIFLDQEEESAKKRTDRAQKENDENDKRYEDKTKQDLQKQKEKNAAQLALAAQFGALLGDLVGATASSNQKAFESATKGILLLLINTLEKSVLATVVASEATAVAGSAVTLQSLATGGVAGVAQAALLTGIIAAAFEGFKAAIAQITFADGGYTGDGGKYQEAGTVHKGEFVTTKEKTAKHRGLLEAIHNDKAPSIADITGLLQGTGVVLMPEVAGRISGELTAGSNQKLYQQQASDKTLKEINENLKKYFAEQGKNIDKTLPDGTRIIKNGSTTRIIRRKK